MPWKKAPSSLPNNYETAMKCLRNTEKRLEKDAALAAKYADVITQHFSKGYIRKVPADETLGSSWYLPHFAIVLPEKTTTKCGIVFDASAKHSGVCLNDVLHVGPKLQRSLVDVLLRFRIKPVGLICDVTEMYLRIEVQESDRSYLRFLWQDLDTSKKAISRERVSDNEQHGDSNPVIA